MAVTVRYDIFGEWLLDEGTITSAADAAPVTGGGVALVGDGGGNVDLRLFTPSYTGSNGVQNLTGVDAAVAEIGIGRLAVAVDGGAQARFSILGANGLVVSGPTTIAGTYADIAGVAVAGGGAAGGPFVVAYHGLTLTTSEIRLSFRTATGGEITTFTVGAGGGIESHASVARLSDGGFAVVWQRNDVNSQIWYAIYEAAGDVRMAPKPLDIAGSVNIKPDVAALPTGGFVVVYGDSGWSEETGESDTDITLARYAANGDFQYWVDLSKDSTADETPSVTVLSTGLLAVGSIMAGDDLRLQIVDPSDGEVITALQYSSATQTTPSVAAMSLGRFASFATLTRPGQASEVRGDVWQLRRLSTGDDADNVIIGDELKDIIKGGGGADVITGGLNADQLEGGAGNDRFRIAGGDAPNGELVFGGDGVDRLVALGNLRLLPVNLSSIEELEFSNDTPGPSIVAISSTQLDGDFNLSLIVKGSNDRDILRVELQGESFLSLATLQFETWTGSVTGDVIEVFGIDTAESLIGSSQADLIRGGGGSDYLEGFGGADDLFGGAGQDRVSYRGKTGDVNLRLGVGGAQTTVTVGGVAEDRIAEIEDAIGGLGNDTLTGNELANALTGGAGSDRLRGAAGNDVLDGGLGAGDAADFQDRAGAVRLTLIGSGQSTAFIGATERDTLRDIEYVYTGAGADVITGDQVRNYLYTGAGNDLVRGGGGNDLLNGSLGSDFLDYRDKTVGVVLTLNGAVDAIATIGGLAEDTVKGFENVLGGSGADTLTGDGLGNTFRGGGGNDTLDGGAGVDSVDFRDKSAAVVLTLTASGLATATVGGVAEDRVRNIENVLGGTGSDRLTGDALANRLTGGTGADELRGGGGADVFAYLAIGDSTSGGAGRDSIRDFSRAQGDKIDLSVIDANVGVLGDQAFVLGALGTAGRLQVSLLSAGTYLVQGDVNGGGADFTILVNASSSLVAGDFVL